MYCLQQQLFTRQVQLILLLLSQFEKNKIIKTNILNELIDVIGRILQLLIGSYTIYVLLSNYK